MRKAILREQVTSVIKEKRLLGRGEYFTTVGAGSTTAFEAGGRSAPRTRSQAWEVHRVGLGFRVSDQGLYDELEGALSRRKFLGLG